MADAYGSAKRRLTASVLLRPGRFGRLFPTLPTFAADTALIRDALKELGAKDGPMDAGDDLSDPISLITDPAKSINNPDNPRITAGFTFLGQFIDHDMTFDPTSSLARQQDPRGAGQVHGEHLGPVGGRIVAEVIIGLIKGDDQSYLSQDPDWTPTHGPNGSFTTVDLLEAAGAVATLP